MAKKRVRGADGGRRSGSSTTAGNSEVELRADAPGERHAGTPGWLPGVLFAALTLWIFRDFVFSDRMLLGGDTLSLGYVARAFYAKALESGVFPLWNPEILGGTPFLEALSGGDSLYPPSALLLLVLEPYRALGWKLVLHVLAAGFFMFGWLRSLGRSRAAAMVSGLGYMASPMLVSFVRPGHDGKLFVMALAPLVFWAVERHFLRPSAKSFASIGLVVALVLLTTHFQMAYFLFGAVGLYAAFRAVQVARGRDDSSAAADAVDDEVHGSTGLLGSGLHRRRRFRASARFGLFLAASVAGAMGAAVQFIPSAAYVTEYSRRIQTTRADAGETGRAWSSSWSLHPEEAMNLLIPEFSGNNAGGSAWTSGTYWGRNDWKDNLETGGIVLLVLAAVSFSGGRRKDRPWFFAGLGAVALLFALGEHTPVWGIFYAMVPGISLFRAPSMAAFLLVFAAATTAGLGVDRMLDAATRRRDPDPDPWKPILIVLWASVAVTTLLAALAASGVLTSLWTSVFFRDVDPGRLQTLAGLRPFITRGAFLSAVMVAGVMLLAWSVRKAYLQPAVLVAGLTALTVADQLRVDGSFVQTLDFEEWARPDPNIQSILDRERDADEPYRLLSFVQRAQDVTPAMHGIELAAGHHPNDLSRYRELIGMVGSGEPVNLYSGNIRRLLNVRYILWPDLERGPGPEGNVVSRTTLQDGRPFQTVYADGGLPRARLVAAATVKTDEEAVAYMLTGAFDPEREVVLAEAPPVALDGGPVTGEVRWGERSLNRLRLSVTSDKPALLVVADNWFPAWKATVNGTEVPVLRAYHTLRAVPVPSGVSTVEMTYRSGLLVRSFWLSLATVLGLSMLGIWGIVRSRGRPT